MHNIATQVRLGFWLYIMSDCVLFASLFATYAVLQNATAGGPSGAEFFSLPFILLETLILLISSFTMGLALISTKTAQKLGALALTFALGLCFISLEVSEFVHLIAEGAGPHTSAYFSAFFTLVGTHGLHVTLGMAWMLVLAAQLLAQGFTERAQWRLQCLAMFWHFLDIIWIFIFTFVYLFAITS